MVKLFSKNSNLCDHNSPTLQTDRQTDGRTDRQTTCDRNTALCTKVHRAVKTDWAYFTDLGPSRCHESMAAITLLQYSYLPYSIQYDVVTDRMAPNYSNLLYYSSPLCFMRVHHVHSLLCSYMESMKWDLSIFPCFQLFDRRPCRSASV